MALNPLPRDHKPAPIPPAMLGMLVAFGVLAALTFWLGSMLDGAWEGFPKAACMLVSGILICIGSYRYLRWFGDRR